MVIFCSKKSGAPLFFWKKKRDIMNFVVKRQSDWGGAAN